MKISILTTITNPEQRQDKWREALHCYCDLADEVVVINGGEVIKSKASKAINGLMLYVESLSPNTGERYSEKVKEVPLYWAEEWNWVELPRHLNAGLKECTGDWVLKLDIDQFMKPEDFKKLREKLSKAPESAEAGTVQKMSFTYKGKYYHKGESSIVFRRHPQIVFGKDFGKDTDLCVPIFQTGVDVIYQSDIINGKEENRVAFYELPFGRSLRIHRTDAEFWNYDYYFKTQEFTRKEFWRFSRAYHRYFKEWRFGDSEENSFKTFLSMQKGRYERAPYTAKEETHPIYIRDAIKNLTPESFGYSGWNLV